MFDSSGRVVSLTVLTSDGTPIPAEVWFKIWLLVPSGSATAEEYYGPFLGKSSEGESGTKLDIDVDNLVKPDGTKGSIPAGSYKIKFADDSPTPAYIGTTDTIELPATRTSTEPEPAPGGEDSFDEGSSSGGGGCDAGLGTAGFAVVLVVLAAAANDSRKKKAQ
jgi:hypothetical protein